MDEADLLECGKCGAVFNNIHHFIDHKTSACKSLEGAISITERVSRSRGHLSREYKKKSPKLKTGPTSKWKIKRHASAAKTRSAKSGFCGRVDKTKITLSKQKDQQQLSAGRLTTPSSSDSGTSTNVTVSKRKSLEISNLKRGAYKTGSLSCELDAATSRTPKVRKVFKVEKILDKRYVKDEVEYLIKWENYPETENCWEPEESILSKDLIEEYEQSITSPKKRKNETCDTPPVELKKFKMEMENCVEISQKQLLLIKDKSNLSSQDTSDKMKDTDVSKIAEVQKEEQINCLSISKANEIKKIEDVQVPINEILLHGDKSDYIVTEDHSESVKTEQTQVSEEDSRSRRSTSRVARDFIKSLCQGIQDTKNVEKPWEQENTSLKKRGFENSFQNFNLGYDYENDSSVIFIPSPNINVKYSIRKLFSYLILDPRKSKSYLLGRNAMYRGKEDHQNKDLLSLLSSHVKNLYIKMKRESVHKSSRGRGRGRPRGSGRGGGRGKTKEQGSIVMASLENESHYFSPTGKGMESEFSTRKLSVTRGAIRSRGRGRGRGQNVKKSDRENVHIKSEYKRSSKDDEVVKIGIKKHKTNVSKTLSSLKKGRGGKVASFSSKVVQSKILSGDNLYHSETTVKRKVGRPPKKPKDQGPGPLSNQSGLPPHLVGPPPSEELSWDDEIGNQHKNRIFVSMPDKTVMEVRCSDTQKALLKAELAFRTMTNSNLPQERNTIGLPRLEECTFDPAEDTSMSKLPNTVLLIESELPVEEAENKDEFVGVYLFSQVFSPNEKIQNCMICPEKIQLKTVRDLDRHYRKVHDLVSTIIKAQYNENCVFVCMPSNVNESTVLKSKCRFCQALLRNLNQVEEHYSSIHGKIVRNIPESQITFLGRFFYCSLCSYPSSTITSHLDHMKTVHSMRTFVCRFCNFCTSQPYKLRLHVRQSHFASIVDSKCPACQIHFKEREELVTHMQKAHAVQTAPHVWSCSKCHYPCEEENQLADHLALCGNSQAVVSTKRPETDNQGVPNVGVGTVFYKCSRCSLTFTAEEEIKKHMEEGRHMSSDNTEKRDTQFSYVHGTSYGTVKTESTCFVCCMRFSTASMCHEHQKHVHMRWVDREAQDHSEEEFTDAVSNKAHEESNNVADFDNSNDYIDSNKLLQSNTNADDILLVSSSAMENKNSVNSTEKDASTDKEEEDGGLNLEFSTLLSSKADDQDDRNLVERVSQTAEVSTNQSYEESTETFSYETIENVESDIEECRSQVLDHISNADILKTQQNGLQESSFDVSIEEKIGDEQDTKKNELILIKDVPTDKQLAELCFPKKVGHYCHLCDIVIQSYPLYYMHMYNVHKLEKRFQCIISDCKRTFCNVTAFQCHAQKHNQKSESFCSLCDMVFEDSRDLKDHMFSREHGTKYIKTQEKYFHSEPRNYRCKVCLTWFGLFAIFVKHMETESHQYRCKYCGLSFVQPGPRRNHIQSVHPEMANVCEICGVKMESSQALWSHLSGHKIVHECPKCRRRFLQKEQLNAHMEVHDPPVPCPWEGCNKKLSSKMGLYNHMKSHQEKRDFDCSHCGKAFFKRQQLEKHLEVHREKVQSKKAISGSCTKKNNEQLVNEESSISLQREGEQQQQSEDIANKELIQLICASCHNGFDSEDQFAIHVCSK
ncbi:uncharacterized protein LOC106460135 isoform X2 [Limulus polyphemus]|uniref:Uncharacterized protein LOC106460135 isoform X2 n=1 Tax=Limulus polyphemus TaxID=6850 RepID=A0ABM1B5K0_LIMPO|nr:uncharacterized protein LOC106460135 isoform X2 [Limulus polyphemus]